MLRSWMGKWQGRKGFGPHALTGEEFFFGPLLLAGAYALLVGPSFVRLGATPGDPLKNVSPGDPYLGGRPSDLAVHEVPEWPKGLSYMHL